MSILLTEQIAGTWFGSEYGGQYYQSVAAALASRIRGRFGATTTRILVAGSGIGHLVNQLAASGYTAVYGVDASQYAVDVARAQYPAIASRFLQGDCRVAAQMATVRANTLGGPLTRRFDLIIAEDLDSSQGNLVVPSQAWLTNHPEAVAMGVTVATPADIALADTEVNQCRSALGGILAQTGAYVHVTSTFEPGADIQYYGPGHWRSGAEWKAMFPADTIYRIPDLSEVV